MLLTATSATYEARPNKLFVNSFDEQNDAQSTCGLEDQITKRIHQIQALAL